MAEGRPPDRPWLPRPLLRLLAVLFAAATVLYGGLWMRHVGREPRSLMGVEYRQGRGDRDAGITRVIDGGPAAAAGVRPGDRIRAIDGLVPSSFEPLRGTVVRRRPGEVVRLTLERPGEAEPLVLPVTLGAAPVRGRSPAEALARRLVIAFPSVFMVVGLVVLFLRLQDRNAWLLALLFAGLIAVAPMLALEDLIPPPLRGFALAYKVIFHGLCGAFFYWFCAVFPLASPIDRRLPWLKGLWLGGAAAVALPLGAACAWTGSTRPIAALLDRAAPAAVTAVVSVYFFGTAILGLASLLWNLRRAPTAGARRKTRVVVWGTVAGVTPFFILQAAAVRTGISPYAFPFWVWAPCVLAVLLLPLSFAYAVVKHRVLEIPLLLKQGARYLLVQRGFTLLLVIASVALTLLFAGWSSEFLEPGRYLGAGAGTAIGAGFGIALLWAGTQVRTRVTERIDRAFFRSAYDARHILQALAEKTSTAVTVGELRVFLARHLRQALHPRSLAIYLPAADGALESSPAGPGRIPADHPALAAIARLGRPSAIESREMQGPAGASSVEGFPFDLPEGGCLVPLPGREARLAGFIVLGERLSEAPYSGEDRRLLASVAGQAALALENLHLAGQIATRMEAERRAAVELDVAREVQSRLLPRGAPRLRTLECAGDCRQARVVGGDYFDFLELGDGLVGLALADIAGKGIAGALMMATLQANLRSQSGLARDDPARLLRGLNRALCEAVADGRYATLFFGRYDDATRRLCYANCGHNPPFLLRAGGAVERLAATATILGAFETWDCTLGEVTLGPGDLLLLYSDGITEAADEAGEEFGETRLLETLRRHRHVGAPALVAAILATVREFSGAEQEDDITLLAARCVG
jgi:sigma-B regulation protein RsbU (phosphoserine phosphatase)